MAENRGNTPTKGATNLRPGDYRVGSPQSRAAARFRLQGGLLRISGKECICFPPDEHPFFRSNEDEERSVKVECPLHGKRFEPRPHFFIAAWRWEREVKLRWPHLSPQYHKAFRASFSEAELKALWERANGGKRDVAEALSDQKAQQPELKHVNRDC